jgi:hypothetical protein
VLTRCREAKTTATHIVLGYLGLGALCWRPWRGRYDLFFVCVIVVCIACVVCFGSARKVGGTAGISFAIVLGGVRGGKIMEN